MALRPPDLGLPLALLTRDVPPMTHRRDAERAEAAEESSELSGTVIGAAIEVHRCLGPGLLESIYEEALHQELCLRGVPVDRQVRLPLVYKGVRLGRRVRLDLVVARALIVEVKAVDSITPIHRSQLLSYLKLARMPLGLLINFNVTILRSGIRRMIDSEESSAASASLR